MEHLAWQSAVCFVSEGANLSKKEQWEVLSLGLVAKILGLLLWFTSSTTLLPTPPLNTLHQLFHSLF